MPLPTYNESIITAIAKVQQNLPFPRFIMGGRGNGPSYKLFKKSSSYVFNLWRSPVYQIGTSFDIKSIKLPINPDMAANMIITPVLYFDNEDSVSEGTIINSTHYSKSERLIILSPKDFGNSVYGRNNFFLELRFSGPALAVVGLPITIDLDVEE